MDGLAGSPAPPPNPIFPPMSDLLDRLQSAVGDTYRIDKELGGGGMSRVFLAEDVELGRRVVIKVLPPEMAAGVNQERFRREIQLAARLQHPHVVPLLSAGSGDDLLYYMMPFIEGESLRAKLTREGELRGCGVATDGGGCARADCATGGGEVRSFRGKRERGNGKGRSQARGVPE